MLFKKSYSQDNEDLFLLTYFKNRKQGLYLDLGCHHPKDFPIPTCFIKDGKVSILMQINGLSFYSNCFAQEIKTCAVINTSNEPVIFYEFDESALNGILSPQRVLKLKEMGIEVKRKKIMQTLTIQNIIEQYHLSEKHIDFLKIDVEGLDFEIIKSLPFLELNIELLMIEKASQKENEEIIKFLAVNSHEIIHESDRNFIFKKS